MFGIVQAEFGKVVEKLFKIEFSFETIMILNNLQTLPWFEGIEEAEYKRCFIAESMAPFGKGIIKVLKLQEARSHFRRAHKDQDTARVQHLLTENVTSFSYSPIPARIPQNPIFDSLRVAVQNALNGWLRVSNDQKMAMFTVDAIDVRPDRYVERHEEGENIMFSGLFEDAGIIQTVGINQTDGRVDAGRMPHARERIHFLSWEQIFITFLFSFIEPVKEWLQNDEGENKVFQLVAGSLVSNLNWNENTSKYFMEGMNAWVSGYPQVALAFWLPHFETALRNTLNNLGEDVINPQPRPGIENFVLFDSLLIKSENYFAEKTVEFWRYVLSTRNGLGWNLRNLFCHGLLPLQAMKQDVYALAILQAYLFLLQPISQETDSN